MKTIFLLGAGVEQVTAIDLAHSAGLRVVAADGNAAAPGLARADVGLHLDIRDEDAVTAAARAHGVNGVMSHAVEIPQVVATVARRLSLPGLDPDVADRTTNKYRRYARLEEAGVPCPKHRIARSAAESVVRAGELAFPLVMKPVDNAGARGVRKVARMEDVDCAYEWAVRHSRQETVLLEEFLEGVEISTESVILDGRIITTGFADRNYERKATFEPFLIEDGHTIPSELPEAARTEVMDVAERAIRALGIDWGVAKGDLILARDGAKVFEMAARTSGGRFCADMVPLATGVQILITLLRMAVGDPVDPVELVPKFRRGAAQRFLFPPAGRIVAVHGVDEVRSMAGVYDVHLSGEVRVGGRVPPLTSHADRMGHVIAGGVDRREAVERAESAVRAIRIEVMTEGHDAPR